MAMTEITGELEDLSAPVLIVSFEDWVDAGQAGSTAARHIAQGGDVVATFDSDSIYDYRSHRPVLDIVDGTPKVFTWPRMSLTRRRVSDRDLLVLTGPEPDYRWKEFADEVLKIAMRSGVIEHVSLGAIPSAVPHTTATPVMMTASTKELMRGAAGVEGLLRVPAAALSLVEWTLAENGIPAVGFWAQVPHYATPYAAGAISLIRRLEDHLSVMIGAGSLEEEVAAQTKALDKVFADNEEAREYLERLEGLMGEEQVPTTENIAAEVERFLRNQRRGDEGPSPFSP
ncbi:MAG: PAC2 family protein [Actinomycetota bacterium]|nr:PAC2 family protein [Actinomycetota bacterium]